jgi:adenylate cyclase
MTKKSLLLKVGGIGDIPTSSKEEKLRHRFLIYMGILMSGGGILWGSITLYHDLIIPSLIPYGYVILTILNFTYLYISKNFRIVRFTQVLISLLLPFFFQWSLGGFIPSGAMMIWSTLAIVGSLTFTDAKSNIKWLILFTILTIVTGLIDGIVNAHSIQISPSVNTVFFVINIIVVSAIVFGLTIYLLRKQEKTNQALGELLEEVELKVEERTEQLQKKNSQLENLSTKLSKYLSSQIYDSIFSGKQDVKIDSRRKKLTVFFSDIKDFTAITDYLESETMTELLNRYLNEMAEIASKYGGTIDKFIGDAVMIFFGDPETKGDKEDAIACVSMAIEMRNRIALLRKEWEALGVDNSLHVRMGINTGFCTVGNFGSESRLDYTIIGGQVNLASRLETQADVDQILISHETYSLIKDRIQCKEKGEINVKGITKSVRTYEVDEIQNSSSTLPNEIKWASNGFSIMIDFEKIDREETISFLDKTLSELKGTNENK